MTPDEIYEKRTDEYRSLSAGLQKRENRLAYARLVSFISSFALFILLFPVSVPFAVFFLIAGLAAFLFIINRHLSTVKEKEYYLHLETINTLEQKSLKGDFHSYPFGGEYEERWHPNSYDLDLFGHASLFQYINRTTSRPASDLLAQWLKAPASVDEIILRQEAVKELTPLIDWRQRLMTEGYVSTNASDDPETLLDWTRSGHIFRNHRRYKAIVYLLSSLGMISTALVIAGMPVAVLSPVITVNFIYYFIQNKKITALHQKVSRSSDVLKTYSETIRLIENQSFHSEKLRELHSSFAVSGKASESIRRLSQLVNRLDTRLNVMVSIPLNLLFFWDIHYCIALEKWKERHSALINQWFSAMAEVEVLSSLGNMAFNNPAWVMPTVTDDYFTLEASDMGHPLIAEQNRICNDVKLQGSGKTMLVTGSNMSGKSTFLRTCGINAVLALAGAPVCASRFVVSRVAVWTSMRISDSLEDNTSSFYAELKRLAAIIEVAGKNEHVFLLLDEILRGTNSNDRYLGSVALVKQLQEYNAVAIVATHDLKLADLAEELPDKTENYHFDVKINGEELYFDYKLTKGICKSLNASLLMKKMGIKV